MATREQETTGDRAAEHAADRRRRAEHEPAGHPATVPAADGGGNGRSPTAPRRGRPAPRVQRRGPVAQLLQGAVDEAARLLEADGAMIYLLDPDSDTLRFAFDAGIRELRNRRWVRRLELQMGQGMFGVAAAERRVVHTNDYPADHTFRHSPGADRFVNEVGLRSMVTAPMVAGDRVFGALGTFARRSGAFTDAQVGLVRALADHAAQAMANALLIEELDRARLEQARRAGREKTLREIATAISALHDQADVIQRTVDESARLLGADGARIDLIDPKLGLLRWAYQSGADRPSDEIWPEDPEERLEQGVSGKAVVDARVVVTGDYLADDQFIHRPGPDGYIASVGLRSVMAAPLIGDRGPFGALTIYSTRQDAWTADDAQLLEALATEAAIAIRNARLIEELGRSRGALARRAEAEQALREIAGRITAIREPSELLQHVVDAAARLVRADGGILDLLDPQRSVLKWSFDTGVRRLFSDAEREELWIPVGVGATGVAVAENRTFIEGDDPRAQFPQSDVNDIFFDRTGFRSMIIAPIASETGPLGAIEVYARRERAFDEADAALIRSLADQAAIAIQNARLIEQLARSREETARRADAERTLREITASISAIREPASVLQQTINEARRLLRADAGIIDLLDQDQGVLRWAYDTGDFDPADRERFATSELQVGKGIAGRAVLERRVIRSGDYRADEHDHSPTADAFAADRGIRSVIVAPIVGESGPVGAIEVYSRRIDAFDDLDAAVLGGLADQAAVTIQNARLIEALDRSADEIRRRADAERALRQIAANISAIRNPDVILQQTVDEAKRLLESTDARIDLLEDGRRLRWKYTSELSHIKILEEMDATFEVGEGVAGLVVAEARPFRTGNYLEDDRFPHTQSSDDFVRAAGLQSALAVPLTGEAGVLGAISVATSRPEAYDDGDVELLTALANQAAIAIQNARLIEELQRSRTELALRADTERSLREMAARIAELRDPDELLRRIVDESRRLLGSDGAHLTRMRDEGDVLVPVVVAGGLDEQTEAWLMGLEFPVMGGINGLAAGLGEPVWTGDYASDDRIPHVDNDDEVAERLGLRSMAAVPLRSPEGGIIGTLAVSYRDRHAFEADELDLLKGLADHAAIALTNTSLYQRLRESEARYRHLVQNSPDLVWSIDAEARLSFVSDTSERLTGWRPEELLGKHFGALVHPSSRQVAEIDWTKGMHAPQQEIRGRLNLLHRDGHAIPAEFNAMGTLDEEGRFAGANGSVRDIRDRDRMERDLRRQAAEIASGEERAHLARELHDSVTQALFSMTLLARTIEMLMDREPEKAREQLGALRELQREALAEMRALIFELRPGNLEQDGLYKALRTHTAALQGRIGLPIVVKSELDSRLPVAIEEVLYRIAQEALHNVVKHAGAREVRLELARDGTDVCLRIADDGKGFDPGKVPDGHLGLAGMRARAAKIGARLDVRSQPGTGTTIEVGVPPEAIAEAEQVAADLRRMEAVASAE